MNILKLVFFLFHLFLPPPGIKTPCRNGGKVSSRIFSAHFSGMSGTISEQIRVFLEGSLPVFRCVHASLYEGLSVGPSVVPSFRHAFFLNAEIDKSDKSEQSNTPANLTNLTKFLCNSILVPYFRRIFVRTNLFFYKNI